MALDREDIIFIQKQNAELEKRLSETIKGTATGVRATIKAEINRVDEMDKIRNGRISKNEEDIEDLQGETKIARWVERNKKLTALILILATMIVVSGYHVINVRTTVEKLLKIELREQAQ